MYYNRNAIARTCSASSCASNLRRSTLCLPGFPTRGIIGALQMQITRVAGASPPLAEADLPVSEARGGIKEVARYSPEPSTTTPATTHQTPPNFELTRSRLWSVYYNHYFCTCLSFKTVYGEVVRVLPPWWLGSHEHISFDDSTERYAPGF